MTADQSVFFDTPEAEQAARDDVERAAERIAQNPHDRKEIASYGANAAEAAVRYALQAADLCMRRNELGNRRLTEKALGLAASPDAMSAVSLHCYAAAEIMRRYDEEYIPAAHEKFAASGAPADAAAAAALGKRRGQFFSRFLFLHEVHTETFNVSRHLSRAMEDPACPLNGLEGSIAKLRTLTKAEQERQAALDEAAEAATVLGKSMTIGVPLKLKGNRPA